MRNNCLVFKMKRRSELMDEVSLTADYLRTLAGQRRPCDDHRVTSVWLVVSGESTRSDKNCSPSESRGCLLFMASATYYSFFQPAFRSSLHPPTGHKLTAPEYHLGAGKPPTGPGDGWYGSR